MPNINDMKDSKYLAHADIGEDPVTVTVRGFQKVNVARQGEDVRYRWVCKFDEYEKPMVMNTTNLNRAARVLGSENTDDWKGKPLELFFDPDVEFGGKIVGGLRVRKAASKSARRVVTDPDEVNRQIEGAVADMDDDIPWK